MPNMERAENSPCPLGSPHHLHLMVCTDPECTCLREDNDPYAANWCCSCRVEWPCRASLVNKGVNA